MSRRALMTPPNGTVAPGTYGSGTAVPVVGVGPDGRVTSITSTPVDVEGGGGAPGSSSFVIADIEPGSPNAKDDEFTAGSLDGKWSWLNQGSSSIAFSDPDDWATITPQLSTSWRGIVQAVPGGNWTMTARLSAGFGHIQDGYAGIWLHGGTDGTGDIWCIGKDGAPGTVITRCETMVSYSYTGIRSNTNVTWGVNVAYLRMTWDGTNIQTWISLDGIRYQPFTAFAPGYTPTKFGIATKSNSGFPSSFDWFRVT